MMQCKYFFWNQTEKCWLENLSSEKGFWLRCENILFSMSSELRFLKWVRFFERNCIVKWVIFLASFCWFWGFLLENQENKKKLWYCPLKRVDEYIFLKTKKYFQKREFQIWDFESFISQIFLRQATMVADIFTQLTDCFDLWIILHSTKC